MLLFSCLLIIVITVMWWHHRRPQTAIEHYNWAAELDYERGDPAAEWYYQRALELAPTAPQDAQFIVDRVGARIQRPATEPDEQHRMALELQMIWDQTARTVPPATTAWHVDTQNVHDTLLSDTVAEQYTKLCEMGAGQPATPINDMIVAIQQRQLDGEAEAVHMLAYIRDHDAKIMKLGGDSEIALVQAVWKQVVDRPTDVMQSFCTSLQDSWNGGSPHCVTGRVSRVVQSLAHMVPEAPELGMLKTREAVRNEIFQSAAKILQTHLQQSGMSDIYNDPKGDAEVARVERLQADVREEIGRMVDTYNLAPDDAQKIKSECDAALI